MSFLKPEKVEVEETHLRVTTVQISPEDYTTMLVRAAMSDAGIDGQFCWRRKVITFENSGRLIAVKVEDPGRISFIEDLRPAAAEQAAA